MTGWKTTSLMWLVLAFLAGTAISTAPPVATPDTAAGGAAAPFAGLPAAALSALPLPPVAATGDAGRLPPAPQPAPAVRPARAGAAAVVAASRSLDLLRYVAALRCARSGVPATYCTPPPSAFPI